MGGYYLPFGPEIELGQTFGSNANWGPNPAGGHNGDDWLSPVGTPIRAAGDGEVFFAGRFDSTYADNWGWNLNYAGPMVILNMDGDTAPYFEYGHLSKVYVQTGQRVKAGQIIALSGADDGGTGVITGPHLHVGCLPYNFNLNTNTYGRVNPRLYMTEYWNDSITVQGEIVTTQEDDVALTDAQAKAIESIPMVVEMLNNIAGGVNGVPSALLDKQVERADGSGTTSLALFLKYADADREATIARIQSAIKDIPAQELAVQIDAAGVAEEVRDALVALISGKAAQ